MSLLTSYKLAGPGYTILFITRVLNVIGLALVVTASFLMLVKTIIVSRFFFFDSASHVITACISSFLVVSEVGLFRDYFLVHWPLLGPNHGFVALGLAMIMLGVHTLGNLNKEATSAANLGLPFWSVVISSGVIILTLGVINILVSYIFCDSKLKITARMVRSSGAVCIQDAEARLEEGKMLSLKPSMATFQSIKTKSSLSSRPSRQAHSPSNPIFQETRATLFQQGINHQRSPSDYPRTYFDGVVDETEPPVPTLPAYSGSEAGAPAATCLSSEKAMLQNSMRKSGDRFPVKPQSPPSESQSDSLNECLKKPDLAHHPSQRQHHGTISRAAPSFF